MNWLVKKTDTNQQMVTVSCSYPHVFKILLRNLNLSVFVCAILKCAPVKLA